MFVFIVVPLALGKLINKMNIRGNVSCDIHAYRSENPEIVVLEF